MVAIAGSEAARTRRLRSTLPFYASWLILAIGLLALTSPAAAADRTIMYSIAQRGEAGAGLGEFARMVHETLNDPRGWSLGGSVRFDRVDGGGMFEVTLAAPSVVGSFGGCTVVYSCRSGSYVLINSERWANATSTYPGAALLQSYRQMVINHEVGHALGFDHGHCQHAGRLAPLMQQQSKGLQGCRRNPWPLPSERSALAARYGVTVAAIAPPLVLGKQVAGIELGARRSAVSARIGGPTARAFTPNGSQETYDSRRLTIVYVSGRVQAVTTRSPNDVTTKGLSVGVSLQRVKGALVGAQCVLSPDDGLLRCTWYRGDRPSRFVLRNDTVVAIRIEAPAPPPTAPAPAPVPVEPPAAPPPVPPVSTPDPPVPSAG